LDIVEKDGRPVAKRGKLGGRKFAYRCEECLEWEVLPAKEDSLTCPACGSRMELAERELMVRGKRMSSERSPKDIRAKVLEQIVRLRL
jgi:nicotinate phosphoribosyltransferase